jgi:hypothetical protein
MTENLKVYNSLTPAQRGTYFHCTSTVLPPYSGKLSKEKIFTNFVVESHPQKFFTKFATTLVPIINSEWKVVYLCEGVDSFSMYALNHFLS